MSEVTHRQDDEGRMRQVVPAWRLRQILREQGETLERPSHFGPDDEWNVEDDDQDDDDETPEPDDDIGPGEYYGHYPPRGGA